MYNSDGTSLRKPGTLIALGGPLASPQVNDAVTDLYEMMDGKINRDGKLAITADIVMAGFKVKGSGDGALTNDLATVEQVQSGVVKTATAGGTVDVITAALVPASTAYRAGETLTVPSFGPNTVVAPTLNKDGLGAKIIKKGAGTALAIGDTGAAGYPAQYYYNGTDFILLNPATENFTTTTPFTSISLLTGPIATPGGRLTLATATPILTFDITATTIFYTPYEHNFIMLFNGTAWETRGFNEISQTLADTTKSPAAAVANSAYDVFMWDDAGTLRATRGPVWTNTTTRSAGTALGRTNGMLVNSVAIANGPAAGRGVYVGSFVTNASNQVEWIANPAAANGGSNARIGLWNMYNRKVIGLRTLDNTLNGWSLINGQRVANGSNNNRITIFSGLVEDAVDLLINQPINGAGGVFSFTLIGMNNAVTGNVGISGFVQGNINTGGVSFASIATYKGFPQLGVTFFQWLELANNSIVSRGDLGGMNLSCFA
jgi:hypothetical protein